MKFFKLLSSLSILALAAAATPDPDNADQMKLDLFIDYKIEGQPGVTQTDVALFDIDEVAVLNYEMSTLEEDIPITVIGTGGYIKDPATGDVVQNLTARQLEPMLQLKPNETLNFKQAIEINLPAQNYIFAPEVYFVIGTEQPKMVQIRNQLVIVSEPQTSVFEPQFLFLCLLFLGIVTISGFFTLKAVAPYFESTAPTKKSLKEQASSARATGKSFNEDWIPEHLKKSKRTKKLN